MILDCQRPFKSEDGRDGRFAFPPAWMDYPTAEYYSGLSRTTLWRLVKNGEVDASRYGRAVRISRESLESFMRSQVGA